MSKSDKMDKTGFQPASYWEARLSAHYDLQGVGDIGLPVSYNQVLYRVRASAFSLVISKLDGQPNDWSVLDVGSGTGFYVDLWLRSGVKALTGSDITEIAVRHLSAQYSEARFIQCDIGQPLPDSVATASFDVVSAFDVLFHIVDDTAYSKAIANIASMVRDGGYFIFSDNLSDRVLRHGPHQVSRTEAEVRALLSENGLEVKRVVPMFVLMNDPVRSQSQIMRKFFSLIYRLAARGEGWGRTIGNCLYPLETALIRLMRRGPSTEIFICQKRA